MSQLRNLHLEQLENRRLLAVDVLSGIEYAEEPRFLPRDLVGFNGSVYLRVNDGKTGPEAWVTDGTPESTRLLKDIRVGSFGSGARDFVEYDGRLYFAANNGFSGLELWATDGTKATTQLVADIWPGSENGAPTEMTVFNGRMYFFANDGVIGRELYSSDGTALGTGPVADSVEGLNGSSGENLMVVGDQMFFNSDSTLTSALGIWVSDGTGQGTRRVPIDGLDTRAIRHMTAFGDRLVFAAGEQLWVTDGTETGSQPIGPTGDGLGALITSVAVVGGKVYVTDELGLHEISDSLSTSRTISPLADHVTASDGKAYFWNSGGVFVFTGHGPPTQLMQFNSLFGTQMGTTFTVPGGMIFNLNRTLDRHEIWVTDGTRDGTKLLEKVTDNASEPFAQFQQIDDLIYFTATNGNFHESVWVIPAPIIDVTPPGTPGDVNGDEVVDAQDIDALYAAIASGSTDSVLDLNDDSAVSVADVDFLVTEILQIRRGDLDLNGKVDFADFLLLSATFGNSEATWSDGDFDGDGNVAFADFLSLSANFGFGTAAAEGDGE